MMHGLGAGGLQMLGRLVYQALSRKMMHPDIVVSRMRVVLTSMTGTVVGSLMMRPDS